MLISRGGGKCGGNLSKGELRAPIVCIECYGDLPAEGEMSGRGRLAIRFNHRYAWWRGEEEVNGEFFPTYVQCMLTPGILEHFVYERSPYHVKTLGTLRFLLTVLLDRGNGRRLISWSRVQILRRQKRHKRVLTSTSASAPSTGQHSQSLSIDKDASKAVLLCSDQYHYTDANGSSEKPRFAISRDRFCMHWRWSRNDWVWIWTPPSLAIWFQRCERYTGHLHNAVLKWCLQKY